MHHTRSGEEGNANARILAVGANGCGYGSGGGDTGGRMVEAEVTPRAARIGAPRRRDEKTARESATRKAIARRKGKDRRRGNGGPAPTTLRYDSPGVANRLRSEPSRR